MLINRLPESFGDPYPEAFEFSSQKPQYPETGEPGISYFAGETPKGTVNCLLWRDDTGELRGILNHYPFNATWDDPIQMILSGEDYMEREGNVNIFVDPEWRRQGIASALLDEAGTRWDIDLSTQRYTELGRKFVTGYSIKTQLSERIHSRYLQVIDGEDLPYGGAS